MTGRHAATDSEPWTRRRCRRRAAAVLRRRSPDLEEPGLGADRNTRPTRDGELSLRIVRTTWACRGGAIHSLGGQRSRRGGSALDPPAESAARRAAAGSPGRPGSTFSLAGRWRRGPGRVARQFAEHQVWVPGVHPGADRPDGAIRPESTSTIIGCGRGRATASLPAVSTGSFGSGNPGRRSPRHQPGRDHAQHSRRRPFRAA
jgi:hypothetical protein